MTFRITGWHPPIDGVARAESRFGVRGACRKAHRHDGADDAFSGAHLAAASVRAVEAAPVVHLLPLPCEPTSLGFAGCSAESVKVTSMAAFRVELSARHPTVWTPE